MIYLTPFLFVQELDESLFPVVSKDQLKTRFSVIKKAFLESEKARQAAQVTEAVDAVKQYFEANPESKVLIKSFPGFCSKAVSAAIVQIKSSGKNAMLLSTEGDKVSYIGVLNKV